ncbi:MAG: sigma-54-dependent Fis family transcriptional regulator [Saprospiraceae bacterium]|nr:sigma-54-dependent Fis family transcriptional regulator [Pyrinomonadaceae bacterium]
MKKSLNALVIDDEPQISGFVSQILESDGWTVREAHTAAEAFELRHEKDWLLVFCDVVLGGTDGYEVLRRYSEELPGARFVLMTGHGSAVGALDATAIGAYDYLVKPFSVDDILAIAQAVREQHHLNKKPDKVPDSPENGYVSDIPLIGKSPKFIECLKMVGRVSNTNLPVLITGESGTGKEVVARAIHHRSKRAGRSFVAVNCGAIPVELIESELFGHAKGSFTGADRERMGLWEEADGGTIFLDEITETNPLFQVKLLRALQQGEIRRVGSNRTAKVDVRVIAATNCDIEEEVRAGRFRQDLMYRLNAVTIHLPALCERIEDIPLLAEHFAKKLLGHNASPVKFSAAALDILTRYSWPGNIRELENAILRAVSLSDDSIYPEHLPFRILVTALAASDGSIDSPINDSSASAEQKTGDFVSLAEMEARYVTKTLAHTGGNKQAAARLLNIDRKTLARIIKRNES